MILARGFIRNIWQIVCRTKCPVSKPHVPQKHQPYYLCHILQCATQNARLSLWFPVSVPILWTLRTTEVHKCTDWISSGAQMAWG